MAQRRYQPGRGKVLCTICRGLLKDPVTTPCEHSYCMICIKSHWDVEDQKKIYSCPQCRRVFRSRPALRTGLQAAPADHCYAGPGDVACDFCTGRKMKALKSCLQCLVSYCEQHLQPHYESPAFEKHKLVDPSEKLQENICTRHNEVMKIFCRTDQQCICYLCSIDEHKGHDTVSAATEITQKQRELGGNRQKINQRIQNREKEVKLLQQKVEAVNHSADKAVEESGKMSTQLVRCIEKRSSDVTQQIRSRQESEVSRVQVLQGKLQQELAELRRKNTELEQLSHTEDRTQFLQNYPSLSILTDFKESSSVNILSVRCFENATAAMSQARNKLNDSYIKECDKISKTVTEVGV